MESNKDLSQQLKAESQALNLKPSWVKKMKEKFNAVFGEENTVDYMKIEKMPPVSVDIFYSPHVSPEDREGLANKFENADIYIPEAYGWSKRTLSMYRNVSMGNIDPKKALRKLGILEKHPFYSVLSSDLSMIYSSKKPIGFIDASKDNPLFKQYRSLFSQYNVNPFESSFEDLVVSCRNGCKIFGEFEKARDDYMLSRFRPTILEVIDKNPKLKSKDKLNVLLFLGSGNTPVFHNLKREGLFDVSRTMKGKQFGLRDEIQRRAMFGKEVDDTLIAQAVAEILFEPVFERSRIYDLIANDYQKTTILKRKLFSTFSLDEVRSLVEEFTKRREEIKDYYKDSPQFVIEREMTSSLASLFYTRFWQRDINLRDLKSMRDLDEFLAKPLPRKTVD